VVYIREAHALDSAMPLGGKDAPIVEDPLLLVERREVAAVCMTKLALEPMPALVDDMDDAVNAAYEAWPDRLYLVAKDGRIAYRSDPGPAGFLPDQLEAAIRTELGLSSDADGASPPDDEMH
jgi:type I thyroxine 5'-deiodinase